MAVDTVNISNTALTQVEQTKQRLSETSAPQQETQTVENRNQEAFKVEISQEAQQVATVNEESEAAQEQQQQMMTASRPQTYNALGEAIT